MYQASLHNDRLHSEYCYHDLQLRGTTINIAFESKKLTSLMTYRPDIDGLRAIAVLAVILFHLNSSWLPGGFLGVDIFFVISGYLIGGILYRELSTNTFSLKRFYLRRMRRILPAFFAMVIPTSILFFICGLCLWKNNSILSIL